MSSSSFSEQKSEAFVDAAYQGDFPLVKSLSLDPEVNLNWQKRHGATSFYCACSQGHVDIVRYLLDFHDNQRLIDYNSTVDGQTPFSLACYYGHEKVVEMLVGDERIDVNSSDIYDGTPLYRLAENGHVGAVKIVLASTRLIDTLKEYQKGKKTAAGIAREEGANTKKYPNESEEGFQRRKKEHVGIASLIESYQKDPQAVRAQLRRELGYPQAPLVPASNSTSFAVAPVVLSAAKKWTTAEVASWLNNAGQNKLGGIAQGQEWEGRTLFGLYSARESPQYRSDCESLGVTTGVLQVNLKGLLVDLFEGGAHHPKDQKTLFLLSCAIMSTFSNEKSKEFFIAAGRGDLGLVKSLSLDPEVNLNWKGSEFNWTPFWNACRYGHVEIVRYLLDFKQTAIDYNLADRFGTSPIMSACYNGHEKVVEMLVNDERIDLNRTNQHETTPLYCASYRGHVGIVKMLLASTKQIDTLKTNDYGKTAADIARDGRAKIKQLWESEEHFQERKKGWQLIWSLIESYEKDPQAVRRKLRRELGFDEHMAGELFALVVFLSDGYLKYWDSGIQQ